MSAAGRRIWRVAQLLGTELPHSLHVGATRRFYITVKNKYFRSSGRFRQSARNLDHGRAAAFARFSSRSTAAAFAYPWAPAREFLSGRLDLCHMTIRQRSVPMVGCECARLARPGDRVQKRAA
jgi:hypothetical protein